jgi:glycine/D-amino acid oxidase-like deaminating enzyme/nitrite reductase/ring-hydroxylating ferredoxin subunit
MYDSARTNGASNPLWYDQLSSADQQTLSNDAGGWPDHPVDLIVIGAGMAGLSTAYHAALRGTSVLVIDKGLIGSGETGRSTAHVSNALDDRYYILAKYHGKRGAQLAAESHSAAIQDIQRIVQSEQIECGFRRVPGYLVPGKSSSQRDLSRELAAARRAGLKVERVASALRSLAEHEWLRFDGQAEIQPLAYLAGLARAIARLGGRIITRTRVTGIEPDGKQQRVHVDGGSSCAAGAVVVATNSPISDRFSMHTKQAAYRSYVLGFELPADSLPRALYWDTEDPYHYVRLAADGSLIAGGEDHKVGQSARPEQHWERLEKWTRSHFPMVGKVVSRWSGQIQEPADGLAYIGKDPGGLSRVFIATGDSGNGITHGAIAGLLLPELIAGQEHPWAALYDPSRKLRAIRTPDYFRENANVALYFAEWLLPRVRAERDIEKGEGRVVRRGLHHVAVYVDPQGARHECSATCPHLGCLVAWNRAEKSWDCPCHGSRFDAYGKLLTGPSPEDLEPLSTQPSSGSKAGAERTEAATPDQVASPR